MADPDDTPRHWLRDLLVGAALVLAMAQTLRISGTQAEIRQLKAELEKQATLRVVYKSASPLVRLAAAEHKDGALFVQLQPLRAASVDVMVFDATDHEIVACRKMEVALPVDVRCPVPDGAIVVSVVER